MNLIIHKIENTSWTWNFVVVSTKYMSDTIHSSSLIIFCAKKFYITHCYFKQYFFVKSRKKNPMFMFFFACGWNMIFFFLFPMFSLSHLYFVCVVSVYMYWSNNKYRNKIVRNDVLKRIKNSTRIIRKYKICDIYNLWYITEFLVSKMLVT